MPPHNQKKEKRVSIVDSCNFKCSSSWFCILFCG
nr:MAG TPA_asm: hypothetical protein [Caudoviricetes sp.]